MRPPFLWISMKTTFGWGLIGVPTPQAPQMERSAKRRAAEVRVPLKLRHELYSPRVAFAVALLAFDAFRCT